MTRRIGPGHDHPRDRRGRWTNSPGAVANLASLPNDVINKYIRRKAGQPEPDDPFVEDDPFGDDPFNEDFGDEEETDEDREQRQYEEKLLKEMEKEERSRLHSVLLDAGGLKTRDDLREEYREIPNTYKRRDGLAGDVMAEYLSYHHPEFGITDERDLIDFLAS